MAISASAANAASRGNANGAPILSKRALNRALLARQMLLERSDRSVPDALRHLFGMQAQAPFPPYFGLWARLRAFDPGELGLLIESRQAVRLSLLRDTVHLVTSDDALLLRPLLAGMIEHHLTTGSVYAKRLNGLDTRKVAEFGRALVEAQPRTMAELNALLTERWPGHDGEAMAMAVRNLVPLVQIPPRGVWGKSGLHQSRILAQRRARNRSLSRTDDPPLSRRLRTGHGDGCASLVRINQTWGRLRAAASTTRELPGRAREGAVRSPRCAATERGTPGSAALYSGVRQSAPFAR